MIVHLTDLQLFIGGGERLISYAIKHSTIDSVCYSRAGGYKFSNDDRFKTYDDDDDLERIIDKHQNDIIITHDSSIITRPSLNNVKRLIWYVHGAFMFQMDVSTFARPVFVFSNYQPTNVHQSWNNRPVFAVNLGVDNCYRFKRRKKTNDRIVVGIVGRISPEKIPEYWFLFLRKFNRNILKRRQFDFRFYGKHNNSDFAQKFFRTISTFDNANYYGEIKPDEMPNIYHQFDVLVVPSLSETGSFAIIESQCCGVRVIALNRDGIKNHCSNHSFCVENYDQMFAVLNHFKPDDDDVRKQISIDSMQQFDVKLWNRRIEHLIKYVNITN